MKYRRFEKIVWIWNYCHNHSILNKQTNIVKIANGTRFLNINKNNGVKYHSVVILCARLCIAIQNLSIGVNVVSKGSLSLILRVLLISLGITIRPRSSTRRTIPVSFIVYLSPFPVGNAFMHSAERMNPFPTTIILQITLLVSVNRSRLYC